MFQGTNTLTIEQTGNLSIEVAGDLLVLTRPTLISRRDFLVAAGRPIDVVEFDVVVSAGIDVSVERNRITTGVGTIDVAEVSVTENT